MCCDLFENSGHLLPEYLRVARVDYMIIGSIPLDIKGELSNFSQTQILLGPASGFADAVEAMILRGIDEQNDITFAIDAGFVEQRRVDDRTGESCAYGSLDRPGAILRDEGVNERFESCPLGWIAKDDAGYGASINLSGRSENRVCPPCAERGDDVGALQCVFGGCVRVDDDTSEVAEHLCHGALAGTHASSDADDHELAVLAVRHALVWSIALRTCAISACGRRVCVQVRSQPSEPAVARPMCPMPTSRAASGRDRPMF